MGSRKKHPGRLRWHYTVGVRFKSIVEDGVILPATAGVPDGERPAVWFSVREPWEPTANKLMRRPNGDLVVLDREETAEAGGGLVRIGVARSAAPVSWREYLRTSGITKKMAEGLAASARRQGSNPALWFVSYHAVPRDLWRAVQVWHEGEWVEVLNGGDKTEDDGAEAES